MSARFLLQPNESSSIEVSPESTAPRQFHQRLPGYAPTPLIDAPEIAKMLGVRQVLLKNESSRFGLPAFKILGASWAVYRALEQRVGHSLGEWQTLDELGQLLAPV